MSHYFRKADSITSFFKEGIFKFLQLCMWWQGNMTQLILHSLKHKPLSSSKARTCSCNNSCKKRAFQQTAENICPSSITRLQQFIYKKRTMHCSPYTNGDLWQNKDNSYSRKSIWSRCIYLLVNSILTYPHTYQYSITVKYLHLSISTYPQHLFLNYSPVFVIINLPPSQVDVPNVWNDLNNVCL